MRKIGAFQTIVIVALVLGRAPCSAQSPSAGPSQSQPSAAPSQSAAAPDPFAQASNGSCRGDARTRAGGVLAALKAYVSAYEANAAAPQPAGLAVVPHAAGGNASVPYYLEVHPVVPPPAGAAPVSAPGGFGKAGPPRMEGGPSGQAAGPDAGPPPSISSAAQSDADAKRVTAYDVLVACAAVTALSSDEAASKGIATRGNLLGLLYVPGVGFASVGTPGAK